MAAAGREAVRVGGQRRAGAGRGPVEMKMSGREVGGPMLFQLCAGQTRGQVRHIHPLMSAKPARTRGRDTYDDNSPQMVALTEAEKQFQLTSLRGVLTSHYRRLTGRYRAVTVVITPSVSSTWLCRDGRPAPASHRSSNRNPAVDGRPGRDVTPRQAWRCKHEHGA